MPIWNAGYWFSSCKRCGCVLVRRGGGRWRVPPKGYRVVWKPRIAGQMDWNGLIARRPNRHAAPGLPLLEAMNDDAPSSEAEAAARPADAEPEQLPA